MLIQLKGKTKEEYIRLLEDVERRTGRKPDASDRTYAFFEAIRKYGNK